MILIGIIGPIYSGKRTIADWLKREHEFTERRPFFLLLAVDAELRVRYERWKHSENKENFNDFMDQNDKNWNEIRKIMYMADFIITNSSEKADLYKYLNDLDITNPVRLRPDYDTYFMNLADLVASRTNCIKRKVGCVLVKDSRVIATGYNGTARGLKNCNEGNCESCSQEDGGKSSTCKCLHAEENALLEVGRENKDCILYCNT
ncbi:5492_t:CDS:2 [Cetraspora pellucida]|uniref:5492_t:CDS:1 n=1 Tax=Cetraspora pellucida TaxID=1433469 RepID=A0ACA9KQ39_9GLOM|nr:5492_t:CDS:2 [Cetraspora pellucida]